MLCGIVLWLAGAASFALASGDLNATIHEAGVLAEIPVVEMGETMNADSLASLRKACLRHGFLILKNERSDGGHHIEPDRIARVWDLAKEFFRAPLEQKMAVHVKHSFNNRGYFSSVDYSEYNQDPEGVHLKDNKEGFFFGSDSLIGPGNVATAGKQALLSEVEEYMDACRRVCARLMTAVASTGLMQGVSSVDFADKYLSDPVYMLKMLKYPPEDGSTGAHTDYGLITLLLPGDSGLEVHVDDAWRAVPVVPDSFVVNFGDLLSMWTSGAVKSTIHRVRYSSPEGKYRYSVPFFMHPSRGTVVRDESTGREWDSYSYVLQKFDKTYHHRQQQLTNDEKVLSRKEL